MVLPVLLTMVLGIFSLGTLFSTQLVVLNATREGARLGALGGEDSTVQDTVRSYLERSGLKETAQIAVAKEPVTNGESVTVNVSYPVTLLFSIPGAPNPLLVKAAAAMRIE